MALRELTYQDFRAKAEKFNAEAQQYSFCKAIEGGCCKRGLNIMQGDKEYLRDAIQKGEIPRETIRRAQRRARDSEEEYCPFLGDQGECTIYPYRPVVCVQHGNGGVPNDEKRARDILGGSSEEITVAELGPFSCQNCISHADQGLQMPEEVVRKSLIIRYESERQPKTSLNTFVTKELPHY